MPGASFASEKGNQQSRASLGFRRIAGQWHAVVGAFSGSAEAQQELIGVLNAADYERLI